jgi:superfamily II DNA or RNA helicase
VSFANKQLLIFRRNLEEAKFLSKNFSNGKITADKPGKEKRK